MNPLPLEQQQALWADAATAGALLAVLGHAAGGILLRARPGPVRDLWLAETRRLQAAGSPWRKVPLHCPAQRLLGGLNLTATLGSGRPVAERGLLAECDGGVALLPMAERADGALVAALASALDTGTLRLEREGVTATLPAAFAVIACDEGADDEEALDASLADRLAMRLDLGALSLAACDDFPWLPAQIAAARRTLPARTLGSGQLEALCAASLALGIDSQRAPLLAVRVATAHAALHGREVTEEDLELALRLVFLPRATQLPASESAADEAAEAQQQSAPEFDADEQAPAPPPPGSTDEAPQEPAEPPQPGEEPEGLPAERLLEAACAALPDALLQQLVARARRQQQSRGGGKSGAAQRHRLRGRPMGSVAGDPRSGARLDLMATLRAAAPWQRLRGGGPGVSLRVAPADFRVKRFRQRAQSVTVFVVDASGSAALYRLAEAKGAVELLLADCYVRRDEVALIAFRGEAADILLPPTRSLVRAKRCLAALPGGGGTPLASAIDCTALLLEQVERRGATPAFVMLTDGRANVARGGHAGREEAVSDALQAAAALRARSRAAGMVIDTSPRPHRAASRLADALGAIYLPLPHADASQLQAAVRGVTV